MNGIRACQETGEITGGDAPEQARLLWSLLHGIASLSNAGRLGLKGRNAQLRFGEYAVRDLINGLRTPASTPVAVAAPKSPSR